MLFRDRPRGLGRSLDDHLGGAAFAEIQGDAQPAVFARDAWAGRSLGSFVNRQLRDLMAQVKNFELVSRQDIDFSDHPAVELVFCMKPQAVVLKQRQLFFHTHPDSHTVHTVVVTAAKENFDELSPVFESILESITWNS